MQVYDAIDRLVNYSEITVYSKPIVRYIPRNIVCPFLGKQVAQSSNYKTTGRLYLLLLNSLILN